MMLSSSTAAPSEVTELSVDSRSGTASWPPEAAGEEKVTFTPMLPSAASWRSGREACRRRCAAGASQPEAELAAVLTPSPKAVKEPGTPWMK